VFIVKYFIASVLSQIPAALGM